MIGNQVLTGLGQGVTIRHMAKYESDPLHELLAVSKALSDQARIRALLAVCEEERCACQLIELLGLAPSTVSKHMALLKAAGLVESRKEGRWVHYRLADGARSAVVQDAIRWARTSAGGSPQARADASRLKEIAKVSLEDLCAARGAR